MPGGRRHPAPDRCGRMAGFPFRRTRETRRAGREGRPAGRLRRGGDRPETRRHPPRHRTPAASPSPRRNRNSQVLTETAPHRLDAAQPRRRNRQGGKRLLHRNPPQGRGGNRRPEAEAQQTTTRKPAGGTPPAHQDVSGGRPHRGHRGNHPHPPEGRRRRRGVRPAHGHARPEAHGRSRPAARGRHPRQQRARHRHRPEERRGGNPPLDRTQETRTRTAQNQPPRDKETLADLEHDRPFFEIKAPADGCLYHGPIENGRWTTGRSARSPSSTTAARPFGRPFATFIPAAAKLDFVAFPDGATALPLEARPRRHRHLRRPRGSGNPGQTHRARRRSRAGRHLSAPPLRHLARRTSRPPSAARARGPPRSPIRSQPPSSSPARRSPTTPAAGPSKSCSPMAKPNAARSSAAAFPTAETEILSGLEIGQVIIAPDNK